LAKTAVLKPVDEQAHKPSHDPDRTTGLRDLIKRHSIILAALALLVVGTAAIRLAGDYWLSRNTVSAQSVSLAKLPARSIAGFNTTVPASGLQAKLSALTHQRMVLTVGTLKTQVPSGTIKSWLQITANQQKTEYYIHVNQAAMSKSLTKLASQYVQAPVDRVTVSEDGTKRVVNSGQNGTYLSDPDTLKTQARKAARNLLAGKGLDFNTPLGTKQFKAATAADFDKLIVVNLTAKKMWLFQNGKQVKSYLVSAGAPETPTPQGLFHVYAKFSSQDMSGLNTDGTEYFQPHVYWVNYFTGGNAIHGVYWHPLSWFGAINSSHGCVGIPDYEAEWVYNWAPIGTTVITHA
jgi:lipoprotein-anchoring transpeptidase ErfK/SrfK